MMRIILACLMCDVLMMSQAFAISGGPFGGGESGPVAVTGMYAGVMIDKTPGSINLGIFTVSIPQEGLASGTNFIFTGERTFSGPVSGLANPNTDRFVGTLQGIPVVDSSGTTIETFNFHADGSIRATVRAGKGVGISSIRFNGTAHVTTIRQGSSNCDPDPKCDPDQTSFPNGCCRTFTDYKVRGFKQSDTAGATSG